MDRPARVAEVEHLHGRVLRVTFTDGVVRELDFHEALPGVLASIDHDDVFALVQVDPVAATVAWPNGIDLDPDVLHGDHAAVSGPTPRIVREYRLQETGSA